jgi:hypothetical protein
VHQTFQAQIIKTFIHHACFFVGELNVSLFTASFLLSQEMKFQELENLSSGYQ